MNYSVDYFKLLIEKEGQYSFYQLPSVTTQECVRLHFFSDEQIEIRESQRDTL